MSRDESPVDGGGYNNAHRAFLQAFLSKPVMTVDDIKPVLAAVMSAQDSNRPTLEGDITGPYITSTLQIINARLAPLDYEVRSSRDQNTKTLTYALVNTTDDALTQLATTFTADEISYIKRLLDCMFEENNTKRQEILAVKHMRALQLASAPRQPRRSQVNGEDGASQPTQAKVNDLKHNQADAVLNQLVEQSFFHESRAHYYSLAPRALMELRVYLKETYNEPADPDDPEDEPVIRIRDCEGCREIVTVGVRCKARECGVRFHDGCAAQYFRSQRGNRECPKCKTDWTGDFFVGERADVRGQGQRGSVGGAGAGGRVSGVRAEYEDEEEEENE